LSKKLRIFLSSVQSNDLDSIVIKKVELFPIWLQQTDFNTIVDQEKVNKISQITPEKKKDKGFSM
jgi:hypothetical protein